MFRRLIIAGAVALGALALPQLASAQGMEHGGPGAMGRGGPDQFRMGGGHGHFGGADQFRMGGGHGHFGGEGDFRFGGHQRPFGEGAGMGQRFSGGFRNPAEHGFRFGEEGRRFGHGRDFGFRNAPGRFGYGERFGERGVLRGHAEFGRYGFRHGYRVGLVRPYPVRVGVRYGRVRFGAPYGRPYLVGLPYGLPRAGCTVRRSVSLTPVGWHKIVTVRTCYVR